LLQNKLYDLLEEYENKQLQGSENGIDNNIHVDDFFKKIAIIMDACDSIEKEEEPTEEGTSSPDLISCSVTASSESDSEEDESSTTVTTVPQPTTTTMQESNITVSSHSSLSSLSDHNIQDAVEEEEDQTEDKSSTVIVGILKHTTTNNNHNHSNHNTSRSSLLSSSNHSIQTRFSVENNQIHVVPRIPDDSYHDLFYEEDEINEFRYEAFYEKVFQTEYDDFDSDDDDDDGIQDLY
jgi:hypothetical protein